MKKFFKQLGWFDIVLILMNIAYPIIFGIFIAPIFLQEILYFQIATSVLLIGFPTFLFFWIKNKNIGK